MNEDFYNPFAFSNTKSSDPTYQAGYYSSSSTQQGVYGHNQFGLGYSQSSYPIQTAVEQPAGNVPTQNTPQGMSPDQVGNLVSGIGRGLSAGVAMIPNNTDSFSIDPFAGYKGSVAGGGMGVGGAVGAIIGGVGAQVGNFSKINRNLKDVNTSIQGYELGPDGRPVYASNNIQAANQTLDSINKGYKQLGGSNLLSKELLADPANMLFSTLFGTKKRLRRKRDELRNSIRGAQANYNIAADEYSRRKQAESAFRNSQFEIFNNSISLPSPYGSY